MTPSETIVCRARLVLILAAVLTGALRLPLATAEETSQTFSCVTLPQEGLQPLAGADASLGQIAECLAAVPMTKVEGKDVRVLGGIPFEAIAGAQVLSSNRTEVTLPVSRIATTMYFLFAVLDPGQEVQAQAMVGRDDGLAIWFKYDRRVNVGPSLGKWDRAALKPVEEKPGKTEAVGEMTTKDGTPVRLFLTRWKNDNEWYPVSRLKWKLLDPGCAIPARDSWYWEPRWEIRQSSRGASGPHVAGADGAR